MNDFQHLDDFGGPGFSGVGGSFGSSPDGLGRAFGADRQLVVETSPARKIFYMVHGIASIAGTAVGAYHGYKRNDSVGWAIAWALMGGLVPYVVVPVAMAQGIGKAPRR